MDSKDNVREQITALAQRTEQLQQHTQALEVQTQAMRVHTRTVERRLRWWPLPWPVAAVAALGLALAVPRAGQATTFRCGAGNVACLIAAITAANANGQPNTIRLAAGTYTLTAVDNDTDGSEWTPVDYQSPDDPGGGRWHDHPRPGGRRRLDFRLVHVAASGNLTLDRVTLRGGVLDGQGGGLFNDAGTVTLTQSTVTENSAFEGGGGLFNNAGTVTLTQSTVTENIVSSGGGGLESTGGTVTLTQSTVDGNHSQFAVGGIDQHQGTLRIIQSRITRNSASNGIGGLFASGTVIITRSTIAGNIGSSEGGMRLAEGVAQLVNSAVLGNASGGGAGGILNHGLLLITNSLMARNSSIGGGGSLINFGTTVLLNTTIADNEGGVIGVNGGTVTVQNTILARNAFDCSGSIISLGNNLIGDPKVDNCPLTLQSSDLTGDPGFDTFTENGTPGSEHSPLRPTSQAIDAGSDAGCPRTDQRGGAGAISQKWE